MNPLGVTQVEYIPNLDAFSELFKNSSEQYLELQMAAEELMKEISSDIEEARAELVTSLDSISSKLIAIDSDELTDNPAESFSTAYGELLIESESLLKLCDKMIRDTLEKIEKQKRDIFKPDFPSQYEPFITKKSISLNSKSHNETSQTSYHSKAFYVIAGVLMIGAILYAMSS